MPRVTVRKKSTTVKNTIAKKKKRSLITPDMLIGEILEHYPETGEVLAQYGFHCIGCMISPYETLEAGAAVHGIPLKEMLRDLNTVAKIKK